MRSGRFEDPQLFVVKAHELSLSSVALLELMRAVLNRNLPFRFCARGWSMVPFIRDGDVITVAPLQHPSPKVGEVIAFVRPGEEKLVVHRVVTKRSTLVITQGDNGGCYMEEVIPKENVLGVVTRIERNGNKVWLGLGYERFAIAWLSRARLLTPLSNLSKFLMKLISRSYR